MNQSVIWAHLLIEAGSDPLMKLPYTLKVVMFTHARISSGSVPVRLEYWRELFRSSRVEWGQCTAMWSNGGAAGVGCTYMSTIAV